MKTVSETWIDIKKNITPSKKSAFIAAAVIGIIVHMAVMTADWPNHDGVASIYFDQNMITSGRWFLTVACGISTYFTIPWIIGIFSLIYLGMTAMLLVDITDVRSSIGGAVIGGLLVSFPATASTFAYVFTMDGYMLGLLMAVAAVAVTKNHKWGWIPGAVLLAFSLGTYQAYLPFAVLLSMYSIILRECGKGTKKEKLKESLRYLYMGIGGAVLYYAILKLLLAVEGKTLDTYQGISGLEGGKSILGLLITIPEMYRDFISFTLKSRILTTNIYSIAAFCLMAVITVFILVKTAAVRKWYRSAWLYITVIAAAALIPLATNVVLLISPDVNYHLIMRFQWVLFPVLMVAFADNFGGIFVLHSDVKYSDGIIKSSASADRKKKIKIDFTAAASQGMFIAVIVLILCYGLADNVGYSNLSKKYERTYSYCVRLLDRIEQTDGYYSGIPIAMIGVVSDEEYPKTDLTDGITDNMIGLSGDYLLYKNLDYESFMKNYLGASLNFLSGDVIVDIYNSDEYREMGSFPAADSIKIVDGVMYIKTENTED